MKPETYNIGKIRDVINVCHAFNSYTELIVKDNIFYDFNTNFFKLTYFEVQTGIKLILLTDN